MNTTIKAKVEIISRLAVITVIAAAITPAALSTNSIAAFATWGHHHHHHGWGWDDGDWGWGYDGFYGHHHKHNSAHQGIHQGQLSSQDSDCFSGIATALSCNNVDVQNHQNFGNNALGQR